MKGKWKYAAAVCLIALFLPGCGSGLKSGNLAERASVSEAVRESAKETSEDAAEAVSRRIKEISFSIREHPIDTDRYDAQADRIYKAAFLKAITNQVPIYDMHKEEPIDYRDLLPKSKGMDEAEFFNYIKQSDYFYQDFDGDGLPELTVNTEGPCVLKYNPEKDRTLLYYSNDQGFNLLGTGQMYYESYVSGGSGTVSEIRLGYVYECVEGGEVSQRVIFHDIMTSDRSAAWDSTYMISVDEYQEIEVDDEVWSELAAGYFEAKRQAPHPMSFASLFGDGDSEPVPRYLLEDREHLPMNEETGEEWELYKAMLEGDFSLVEDEHWTSLQSHYESSLEDGDGRCDWDYFLMDFNQDGRKELCIRFYPEWVNNTAFFRYDEGVIKMWGSYNSADSHGYELPLRNGKMMSVSWYQDDKTRWIGRLGPEFYYIQERCYESGVVEDEETPFYNFQDYYRDGQLCGSEIPLSDEEWAQIEDMIEGLLIPEDAWRSCSVFTPASERPEIPGVG